MLNSANLFFTSTQEHFIDAVQRACLTSTDERLRAFASPTHRAFVRASIHKKVTLTLRFHKNIAHRHDDRIDTRLMCTRDACDDDTVEPLAFSTGQD